MVSKAVFTVADTISFSDLTVAVGLVVLLLISWFVPERFWSGFCRLVSPLVIGNITSAPSAVSAKIARFMDAESSSTGFDILRQLAGEHVRLVLQLLRDYRPGGWRPDIRIDGIEHVESALAKGRGAIIWIGYNYEADLVAKMAFYRAGLQVHHLSRQSHGFSSTRFGYRYLNRVQTYIEDRYIGKRVMLNPDDPKPALDALVANLARNGVVSITARHDAKRPVRIRFGHGRLRLAPGAPVLSVKTGAALLPAFAFRDLDGHYRLRIFPLLNPPAGLPRDDAVVDVAERYGELLLPFVRRYPGQWLGWLHL